MNEPIVEEMEENEERSLQISNDNQLATKNNQNALTVSDLNLIQKVDTTPPTGVVAMHAANLNFAFTVAQINRDTQNDIQNNAKKYGELALAKASQLLNKDDNIDEAKKIS